MPLRPDDSVPLQVAKLERCFQDAFYEATGAYPGPQRWARFLGQVEREAVLAVPH